MVHDGPGLHHYHKRKREKFPVSHKWKRFMDKAIYGVGIFGPLMTLPQIGKIWIEKNASGVSLLLLHLFV